jgi:hypothetical protein
MALDLTGRDKHGYKLKASAGVFFVFFFLSFGLLVCPCTSGEEIAIYGDSQTNPEVQQKIVKAILSFKPSVVFRVGDIVNDGNDPKLWRAFNDYHGPLLRTTEYFPALGNHENGSPLYFDEFPFLNGQRWYSIDRMGIHFVVLDSNSKLGQGSEQYRWLESDLAGAGRTAKFIIALFHHPIIDVSIMHKSDEKKLGSSLLPLFRRYGVSAVFSGHSHDYQRYEDAGIYFIVTGGGGSNLYGKSRDDPRLQKFSMKYHFCLLKPQDGYLSARIVDVDSNMIDDFKIPSRP